MKNKTEEEWIRIKNENGRRRTKIDKNDKRETDWRKKWRMKENDGEEEWRTIRWMKINEEQRKKEEIEEWSIKLNNMEKN